jgi:hypothetical protein
MTKMLKRRYGKNSGNRATVRLQRRHDFGDERILISQPWPSRGDKIPFRELKRAADAFRDGLGNVIRLGVLGFRVL